MKKLVLVVLSLFVCGVSAMAAETPVASVNAPGMKKEVAKVESAAKKTGEAVKMDAKKTGKAMKMEAKKMGVEAKKMGKETEKAMPKL